MKTHFLNRAHGFCLNNTLDWGLETDLFGADERGHDAHVWREEELQTHDEDGQDGEGQQLQAVVHHLHTHGN